MGLKHWVGGLVFLLMAVGIKAHMIFIRMVILAAAGLAGLFLLHVLARDYRQIQANRPKAFSIFKRSVGDEPALRGADIDTFYSEAHQKLEQLQSIQYLDNSVSLVSAAAKMDPQGCARRYICSIAASPPKAHSPLEAAILDLIETRKDAAEFKAAAQLGRELGSSKQCNVRYPRCRYSVTEMLRLIQPFY